MDWEDLDLHSTQLTGEIEMADVETKITIKLDYSEFKALQKVLILQYHHDIAALPDNEKDLVNGIFFKINDSDN